MNRYEIAIRGDKVGDESLTDIVDILGRTFAKVGQVKLPEEVAILAVALNRLILERHKNLTIQEVSIAMENGVLEDYGEYFGLNIQTFNNWLKAYTKSDQRFNAKKTEAIAIALPPPSKEYNNQRLKIAAIRCFEGFKNGLPNCEATPQIYQLLNEIGLINAENQTAEYRLSVLEQIKKQINSKKRNGSISNYLDASGGWVIAKARELCLFEYFKELIVNKIELKELINGTK